MAKIEVRWLWAFIALETTNSAPRLALRSLATLAHPSLWGHLYFAELGTFLFCIDSGRPGSNPSIARQDKGPIKECINFG